MPDDMSATSTPAPMLTEALRIALRDAQARAMAEVARRYALPLAFTPQQLQQAASAAQVS